jgi:hypothetical protein
MRKDGIEGSPWELIAELDPDRTEFNYLTSTRSFSIATRFHE